MCDAGAIMTGCSS